MAILPNRSVGIFYIFDRKKTEKIRLIARVYDGNKEELASRLFSIDVRPGGVDYKTLILDKWTRHLKEGEEPASATIEFYRRRLLGY